MRRLFCWIKAIPFFVKSGFWCPHIYGETTEEPAIIISTENSFRISNSYEHQPNETVHKNAILMKSKCIYCGKEEICWYEKAKLFRGFKGIKDKD